MTKARTATTRTIGDLATLLDLDASEARYIEVRVQLLNRIIGEVRRRNLTHAEAADLAGTSRTRMTAILNGNLRGISTDLLLRILTSLGLRARITFARVA